MSLGSTVEAPATTDWWRSAVVYQLYIRSFADGDGDGIGDIAGIRARLGHLRDLGVDAVWINPWYPSPMADAATTCRTTGRSSPPSAPRPRPPR